MSLLPSTIGPIAERNMPGACKLMLVAADDIVTFPDEVNGTVQAIAIAEDAVWMEVNGTRWTQVFSDTWTLVDGKQLSRALCMLELPKDRPALLAGLWKLKHRRHVVLHFDMNGTIKVMGTKEEPATVRLVSLEHGGDPRNSANRMGLQVEVVRGNACPFYLATPPTPATPGSCPTVAEQIAPLDWSAIEALLDEDQLAAAETSICEVPSSLCELIDEAIVLGGGGGGEDVAVITGAGTGYVDGTYPRIGTTNTRGYYFAGSIEIYWNGTRWYIDEAGVGFYYSDDDVAYPWEVTTWIAYGAFVEPLPTVTQNGAGGGASDVSAITDCLDTAQAGALLDGLLEDREWSDIEGRLSDVQIEDATTSLGGGLSLCEMIDAALTGAPTNSFTTTGAGATEYNLSWALDGTQNGKDRYTNGTFMTAWSGTAWVMINESVGTEFYQSTDDTEFPWEATGWTAMFGIDTPVPTLTQDGGIDATAVTDCLDPLQAAAVVAALGGSAEPGTAQLVDSNGDPIGSAVSVPSGPTVEITVPQSAFSYKDAANADQVSTPLDTVVLSGVMYAEYQFPRRQLTLRGVGTGQYVTLPDLVNNTVPDITGPLKFGWTAGDADTLTWTVTADEAGTYSSYTQDGSSGTITYSKNGGGFAALSGSIALAVSDTIVVRRTTTTSAGYSKWVP